MNTYNFNVDSNINEIDVKAVAESTLAKVDVSSTKLKVGNGIIAIGNALGYGQSVTTGVVSALNRTVTTDVSTTKMIQIDAAINGGNSGGALVNADGNVIGINTLKLSGTGVEGIGFAIPINSTLDVYNELKTNGKISRPFMGIGGVDITETLAKKNNLVVGVYIKTIDIFRKNGTIKMYIYANLKQRILKS